jgi:hypothetical protein
MGNDQDDLEISDEEKPDISGLFVKPDNINTKGLLNEENKDEIKTKEINDNNKNVIDNEEKKDKDNNNGEKFYKVIEQESVGLNNNELNPIGFKYNIVGNTEKDKKVESSENAENKSNKDNEEENEEEEEDIENINKNIFN